MLFLVLALSDILSIGHKDVRLGIQHSFLGSNLLTWQVKCYSQQFENTDNAYT